MYLVFPLKKYKKSFKKVIESGKISKIEIDRIVEKISFNQKLSEKYKDHALSGDWKGYRECHIKPDILLIYKKEKKELILLLIDIGSHSSLFK